MGDIAPRMLLTHDNLYLGSEGGMHNRARPLHATHLALRSCPGVHVADNFLYITIAMVLASFTILPALDSEGNPLLPDPDYSTGLGGIWCVGLRCSGQDCCR